MASASVGFTAETTTGESPTNVSPIGDVTGTAAVCLLLPVTTSAATDVSLYLQPRDSTSRASPDRESRQPDNTPTSYSSEICLSSEAACVDHVLGSECDQVTELPTTNIRYSQ